MEPINLQTAQRKFVLRLKEKALKEELQYQSLKWLAGLRQYVKIFATV
jgi:hypothetical protein